MNKKLIAVLTTTGFVLILLIIVLGLLIIPGFDLDKKSNESATNSAKNSSGDPKIKIEKVIDGFSNPWDLAFLNNDTFIYNLRAGEIRGYDIETKEDWLIEKPSDVYASGEGGLLGLAVDVKFGDNGYIYTCMNVISKTSGGQPSISIVRWTLADDFKSIKARKDIITDMPSNPSGRHSGCRLSMGKDTVLWIGTGDTAVGRLPQDPKSLGGKILRVDRDGKGVSGNLNAPFDSRIFSYGHRNTQGITLFDEPVNGSYGFSAEHGSDRDDEINKLVSGNFGWDPIPGYNETVNMTDLKKYPNAIPAAWSSGNPTIAISGISIIKGEQWGSWDGGLLVSVLKDRHISLQKYDSNGKLLRDEKIVDGYGRIRTIRQAPNGDLYFSTDNGYDKDAIYKVSVEK